MHELFTGLGYSYATRQPFTPSYKFSLIGCLESEKAREREKNL